MKKFSEKGESFILHLILASLDLIFFRSTRISKKSNIQYFCSFTVLFFYAKSQETLYKKWSFPLRISSVNVTTSHLLKKSLMKNFIFCAVKIQCRDFKKKTKGSAWGFLLTILYSTSKMVLLIEIAQVVTCQWITGWVVLIFLLL